MSNAPTYTDLMAHKLYMDELNAHLKDRGQNLINQLADANEALLQQAKEIDELYRQLEHATAEIRALKRQLISH